MIDYDKQVVATLSQILPTYFELHLSKQCSVPCISYILRNDYTVTNGDTIGYSKIQYQVKVWSNKQEDLQTYSAHIDKALRQLGFSRISTGEIYDINSAMKQKIMVYEAQYKEDFD